MDAHRLRSVLDRIIGEHGRLSINHKFAQVIQALGQCSAHPGGATDEELRSHLSDLLTALRQSRTNDFVESDRRILVEIQGERHTGLGLSERISAITSESPFLPGRTKEAMVEIADELQRFLGVCAAAQAAMQQLNIAAPGLAANGFELGILLPDKLIQGDLDRVLKEIKDWNAALRDLIPVISQQTPCVVLRTHSAQRFELSAPLEPGAALALGTAIAGIYEMFERIKNNRERAAELERQHYPPDLVKRMKEYERELIPQAMAEVRERFKARFVRPSEMKPRELDKTLERTLRFMAMRIRDGVEVELIGPMSVDTTAPGEQADRSLTHHVRQALQMAARMPATKEGGQEPAVNAATGMPAAQPQEEEPRQMPLSVLAGFDEEEDKPQAAA